MGADIGMHVCEQFIFMIHQVQNVLLSSWLHIKVHVCKIFFPVFSVVIIMQGQQAAEDPEAASSTCNRGDRLRLWKCLAL